MKNLDTKTTNKYISFRFIIDYSLISFLNHVSHNPNFNEANILLSQTLRGHFKTGLFV